MHRLHSPCRMAQPGCSALRIVRRSGATGSVLSFRGQRFVPRMLTPCMEARIRDVRYEWRRPRKRWIPTDKVTPMVWAVAVIVLVLIGVVAWRIWAAFNPAEFVTLTVYSPSLTRTSQGVQVTVRRVTPRPSYEVKRRMYEAGRRGPLLTKSGSDDIFIEGTVLNTTDRTLLLLTLNGAGLRLSSGEFAPLAVSMFDSAGERTYCETHAGQVELPSGTELRYTAQLSPRTLALRSPVTSTVEKGHLPEFVFSPMVFGVCRDPAPEPIEPIRFGATALGAPDEEDFYPFTESSCELAAQVSPSGKPYWISPVAPIAEGCGTTGSG